ncbi:putative xylan-binding protein with Ca-dependent carbohydrate-binding module, partial [Cereibacter johrii]
AGWKAIAGGRIEVWDAHRGVTATDGSQFVELDFHGARDGFFQDVDAATGEAHTLSFDLRARPGAPVSSQGVEVVWNDRVVATATPGADWGTFTTTVTGAAGTDRLIIREVASQGGDGLGALVDDFVLVRSEAPTDATAPDTLSVRVSGDAWQGDPAFALLVNGVMVAPSTVVTADRAAGEWQTLTFTGDWDLDGSDQVSVRFLEDSYAGPGRDRNLYVDEVRLNGEVNGADRTFLQTGTETWDF